MNVLSFLRRAIAAPACLMVVGLAVMDTAGSAGPAIAQTSPGHEAQPQKMLRYAFLIAQTTFDPAQITDLYSRTMAASIFDAPFENAFLARPTQMRTNTAAALPEVSEDFKTFTIRIRPAIYFADDPAFKGPDGKPVKRELTADPGLQRGAPAFQHRPHSTQELRAAASPGYRRRSHL